MLALALVGCKEKKYENFVKTGMNKEYREAGKTCKVGKVELEEIKEGLYLEYVTVRDGKKGHVLSITVIKVGGAASVVS